MGIQPIGGFGGGVSYYAASRIPAVSPEEVSRQQVQAETAGPDMAEPDHSQEISQPSENIRQTETDLENISLTFNREDDFGYIGSESGLDNLDVQKAISDMRKDQVLQQYQYFVGSAQNLFQSEDGVVIPKFGQ